MSKDSNEKRFLGLLQSFYCKQRDSIGHRPDKSGLLIHPEGLDLDNTEIQRYIDEWDSSILTQEGFKKIDPNDGNTFGHVQNQSGNTFGHVQNLFMFSMVQLIEYCKYMGWGEYWTRDHMKAYVDQGVIKKFFLPGKRGRKVFYIIFVEDDDLLAIRPQNFVYSIIEEGKHLHLQTSQTDTDRNGKEHTPTPTHEVRGGWHVRTPYESPVFKILGNNPGFVSSHAAEPEQWSSVSPRTPPDAPESDISSPESLDTDPLYIAARDAKDAPRIIEKRKGKFVVEAPGSKSFSTTPLEEWTSTNFTWYYLTMLEHKVGDVSRIQGLAGDVKRSLNRSFIYTEYSPHVMKEFIDYCFINLPKPPTAANLYSKFTFGSYVGWCLRQEGIKWCNAHFGEGKWKNYLKDRDRKVLKDLVAREKEDEPSILSARRSEEPIDKEDSVMSPESWDHLAKIFGEEWATKAYGTREDVVKEYERSVRGEKSKKG